MRLVDVEVISPVLIGGKLMRIKDRLTLSPALAESLHKRGKVDYKDAKQKPKRRRP